MKKPINSKPNPFGKVKYILIRLFALVLFVFVILAIVMAIVRAKKGKKADVTLTTFEDVMNE
jgi:preprotein translocase subunit SecG